MEQNKYDVFISYSSKDQKIIEALCHYLEAQNLRCFVAYRDIPKGADWGTHIPPAIENSKVFVYVHTKNANKSLDTTREIQYALDYKRVIIPFRIENVVYDSEKDYRLKCINWLDAFPGKPEDYFGELYKAIKVHFPERISGSTPTPPNPYPVKKWMIISLVIVLLGLIMFLLWNKKQETKLETQKPESEIVNNNIETQESIVTYTVNGVSFNMIRVEGGIFNMGAQDTDPNAPNYDIEAYDDESPVHSVTLSDYYIGETEVTQELWEAVMGSNPSNFKGDDQRPVESVSYKDIEEFCRRLEMETGKDFRLPTEAEWEYAARGGNKTKNYKYSGSNEMDYVGWYSGNSEGTTHPVKSLKYGKNELGIYDMSGNVWEWCQDLYGSYSSGSQTNPTGPSSGSDRVLRGGSWFYSAKLCRVSSRSYGNPGSRSYNSRGFRLALSQ